MRKPRTVPVWRCGLARASPSLNVGCGEPLQLTPEVLAQLVNLGGAPSSGSASAVSTWAAANTSLAECRSASGLARCRSRRAARTPEPSVLGQCLDAPAVGLRQQGASGSRGCAPRVCPARSLPAAPPMTSFADGIRLHRLAPGGRNGYKSFREPRRPARLGPLDAGRRPRLGHLGLLDEEDLPRVLAVTFAVWEGAVWSAIDHKPKRTPEPARVRRLRRRPEAALLVDHYDDDWSRLAWVELRGRVSVEPPGPALDALAAKSRTTSSSVPRGRCCGWRRSASPAGGRRTASSRAY